LRNDPFGWWFAHEMGGSTSNWCFQKADKLTLFAVENVPFIDDLPLNIVIFYS